MATDVRIWTGSDWQSLQGPPGPTAISPEPGNRLSLDNTGLLYFTEDTDSYVICKPGDDFRARYLDACALKPDGEPLSSANRATMIVFPGTYGLGEQFDPDVGYFFETVDTQDFVDIVALGAVRHRHGCSTAVTYRGEIVLYASDVRIFGLAAHRFVDSYPSPNQTMDSCIGGDDSWLSAAGRYINCQGGYYAFAGASGEFVNCLGGDGSFSRPTGVFVNCRGGNECFAINGEDASGLFVDCQGGDGCFGWTGNASGVFINCRAGLLSFGASIDDSDSNASGTFRDCVAGVGSFGGTSFASGTFYNCVAGMSSFGAKPGNGTFHYCVSDSDSSFMGAGSKFFFCVRNNKPLHSP